MNLKKIGLFAIAMIMTLFSFQPHSFVAEEMEWVKKAPMPTARNNAESLVYDGKVYVYGGTTGMDYMSRFEVYDPSNDEWKTLSKSSYPRYNAAFVENNGRFYALCGYFNKGETNIVEVFDPASNRWSTTSSMPRSRAFSSAVSLDDTIYSFGGVENDEYTSSVYSFNTQLAPGIRSSLGLQTKKLQRQDQT
ncbi:Kelch repeat-containing protein [Brevibacillus laterosporus]|uniref:Kelch repeat-containing protein n=1 Tax=Brevibacillus laterosporus TaxID=1465 RepID=UPI000E6C0661|nr:kelch repeat-containing protein [Brevibacillus laterosporus]AYB39900.1 hypothetical protein D5F52_17420 [Brevibacillus laterosporus]MBM7110540.1 N-acetylneuraminate epimerase [Brevibacillus laterosporus]NKQ22335.1 hypothetical protein [Brevibacillus laterosporus]WNX31817.1 kelch repeat-containing protein [Brevibacillus laterosporus]